MAARKRRQRDRPRPGAAGPPQPARRISGALTALLVAAGVWSYSNSVQGVLVLDDIRAIVRNQTIRSLWPPSVPLRPPTACTVAGRPVANWSFAVNYALAPGDARDTFAPGGPGAPAGTTERFLRNVWGYHALNLAIHLAAGLTLFGVVRRTLLTPRWRGRFDRAAPWLAFVVAALWLVHPLQTESVTYIVQRVESLAGLFYLLTLYAAIRAAGSARGAAWTVVSVAAAALGMATKEVMVTAPVVVWLWDLVFLDAGRRRSRWPLWAGLAATWTVLGVLVYGERRGPSIALGGGMWWRYLLTQAEVIAHYLRLSVFPSPLVFLYTWPIATTAAAVAPQLLLVAALALLAAAGLVKRHPLGFAGAWFFLVLAPTSSVLPIVTEVAAEHRMYLPLAAVLAVAVIGSYTLGKRPATGAPGGPAGGLTTRGRERPFWRPSSRPGAVVGLAVAGALIVAAGVGTRARNRDYWSAERLWHDTVTKQPGNSRARVAYGAVLLEAGRAVDAEAELRAAIAIDPADGVACVRLGAALAQQGRMDEAIPQFERALVLRPDDLDAHRLLGQAYARSRQDARAVVHLGRVLEVVQNDPAVIGQLAVILVNSQDPAVRDVARALTLAERAAGITSRRDPEVLNLLAGTLAAAGRLDEAARTAEEGLGLARAGGNEALARELEMRAIAYRAKSG